MAGVGIKNISKNYGDLTVLKNLVLSIFAGEFMVLVGPSGCGKSTLLRMIAGLEDITSGTIEINNQVVNDLSAKARQVAMVFQNYALYPHMTVRQNMGFALKLSKMPKAEIALRVNDVAKVLGIEDHLDKKPSHLSGGQKQRVAMGRAMVRNPRVFLFDEPLSNLDAQLRVKMRSEIALLHRKLKSTVIYVTHDQVEAMTLADRIAVMNNGVIEQVGTPLEVYHNPNTKFVASFIGTPSMNFFPHSLLKNLNGEVHVPNLTHTVGVRPESIIIGQKEGMKRLLQGRIALIEPLGSLFYVHISHTEGSFDSSYSYKKPVVVECKQPPPPVDEMVELFFDPETLFYFDEQGKRL